MGHNVKIGLINITIKVDDIIHKICHGKNAKVTKEHLTDLMIKNNGVIPKRHLVTKFIWWIVRRFDPLGIAEEITKLVTKRKGKK